MQKININELKSHPQNEYYFDNMEGEKWKEFLDSVNTSGIIEPIVITQDKVIVSGHQRVRAAKELCINDIMCEIRIYDDNDKITKDLLETNIRQRGTIDGSAVKQGRRYIELERIYGVYKGNHQKENPNNSVSQSELAKQNGVSVDTWNNYKKLTQLIPEVVDLVDTGIVTPTTALSIVKNLKSDEQEELIQSLDVTKKLTQKEVQQYIDKIKQLENKEPEIVEIDNTDYSSIEQKKKELKQLQDKYNSQSEKINVLNERIAIFQENSDKYKNLTSEIERLTKDKSDIARRITAVTSISGLSIEIDFLLKEKLAPIKYSSALLEAKTDEIVQKNLSNIVYSVQRWCDEMKEYLPSEDKNNVIDMEEI